MRTMRFFKNTLPLPEMLVRAMQLLVSPSLLLPAAALPAYPVNCERTGGTVLTCHHSIPAVVPAATKHVYIREYSHSTGTIPEHVFSDISWRNVTKFDVTTNEAIRLTTWNFKKLESLKHLGIHAIDHFEVIEPHSFGGIDTLTHLDMSRCIWLTPSTLLLALLEDADQLRNLRYLNLNYLHSVYNRMVHFDDYFTSVMETLPIETLTLRGTNLIFSADESKFNQSLQNWSLRNIDLANISFSTFFQSYTHFDFANFMLSYLNLSSITFDGISVGVPGSFIVVIKDTYETVHCSGNHSLLDLLLLRPKYVFANNVLIDLNAGLIITNYSLTVPNCERSRVEVFAARGNHISKINATLIIPDNSLREVDLASNKIHYISPNALQSLTSLETILLKDNELYKMEHLPEFEQLFNRQTELIHLDMSLNKLSYIPYGMFEKNTELRKLDLSENKLQSLTFNLTALQMLETLRLNSNMILQIDLEALSALMALLLNQAERNNSAIELYNNPFMCSCSNIAFLQWIVDDLTPATNQQLTCNLENENMRIGHKAIEKAKDTCSKLIVPPSFWVILSVYVASVVSVILLFVRRLKEERKKIKNIRTKNNFIQMYIEGNLKEKHVVFLSENIDASNEDEDVAFGHLLAGLKGELLRQIGNHRSKVIVADNAQGKIGYYRDEAADNFIEHSCVVLILISVTEPNNRYFKTDLELAKAYNKPVCLLSCKMGNKDSSVLKQCTRYPTVDLEQDSGVWKPQMGWGKLCDQVLTMASRQHYEKQDMLKK